MLELNIEVIVYGILTQLTYLDILNFRLVNNKAYEICTDSGFWKYKLDYDFTNNKLIPSHYVTMYKQASESWYNTYSRWYYKLPKDIKLNGTLYTDICIFKLDCNIKPCTDIINFTYKLAIYHNNLPILNKLYNMGYIFTGFHNLDGSYIADINLEVLDWLDTHTTILYTTLCNDIMLGDRIDIMDWLADRNVYPSENEINWSLFYNKFNIVAWAIRRGIYPSQESINRACRTKVEILLWLLRHDLYPDRQAADQSIKNGNLPMLQALMTYHIYPNQRGINHAIHNDKAIPVLEWLWTQDMYPDQKTVTKQKYSMKMKQWLESKGII